MTNGEKYKTAHERAEVFYNYCLQYKSCKDCALIEFHRNSIFGRPMCAYSWLDLEAEEKPETIEDIVKELRNEPLGEGGAKPWLHYLADRISAAHNRAAKKRREEIRKEGGEE